MPPHGLALKHLFGNEGVHPMNQFHYVRTPPRLIRDIPGTNMRFEAWPLSHSGVTSTAFLIFNGPDCLLYIGDTGPDEIEHTHLLADLWKRVMAPCNAEGDPWAELLNALSPPGGAAPNGVSRSRASFIHPFAPNPRGKSAVPACPSFSCAAGTA